MVYPEIWARAFSKIKNTELGRFLVVGAGGFLVNFASLWFWHGLMTLPLLVAQTIAAETAILFNFSLHHHWTYRGYRQASFGFRLLKFHGSAWIGAAITTATLTGLVYFLHLHYLAALAVGGLVAMVWNYLLNKIAIWPRSE